VTYLEGDDLAVDAVTVRAVSADGAPLAVRTDSLMGGDWHAGDYLLFDLEDGRTNVFVVQRQPPELGRRLSGPRRAARLRLNAVRLARRRTSRAQSRRRNVPPARLCPAAPATTSAAKTADW